MDCGSFSKEIVTTADFNSKRIYIRAQRCDELCCYLQEVEKWEIEKIGLFGVEVCSVEYSPFGEEKKYRYVIN